MKITSFSPTSVKPGDEITITVSDIPKGATQQELYVLVCGMATLSNVRFGNEEITDGIINATVTEMTHSGEITVTIHPDDAPPVSAYSNKPLIVEHTDGRPEITNVMPKTVTSSEQVITIEGDNLSDIQFVKCAGVEIYEFTLSGETKIQCTLPLHLIKDGPHRMSVNKKSLGSFYAPSHIIIETSK
jgi:hypothetical protein